MSRLVILPALLLFAAPRALAQGDFEVRKQGDKNVIVFEADPPIVVPPPKPGVMVVITRQNLDAAYEIELRSSFLDNVVQSVEKGPF
jgi:hypothetical protein